MRKSRLKNMIESIRIQEAKLEKVFYDQTISEWTRDHEVFALQQSLLILRQTLVDMLEEELMYDTKTLKAVA